jgi:hypothetical protein
MVRTNYLAVVVAALAAFVASAVWYIMLGNELAQVSPAFAEALAQKPQPLKMLAVFGVSLVIALVLAHLHARLGINTWSSAAQLGLLLWIGLCATQWASSMVWEKVPLKMAAIHSGDWLVKLLIMSIILGVWRRK